MKLTGTNRPTTYTTQHTARVHYVVPEQQPNRSQEPTPQLNNNTTVETNSCNTVFPPPHRATGTGGTGNRVTAVIAWGKRPVPFRTRKLRPTAPMVLHPGGCGRVGHRRTTIHGKPRPPGRGSPHLTTKTVLEPIADRILPVLIGLMFYDRHQWKISVDL